MSGFFSKVVTQAVLLFGTETWVLIPRMERGLSSFRQRVVRHITRTQPRIYGGGSWEYNSLEEAMVKSGFEGIGTYITRRQNTVAQNIATQPIMDLCVKSSRRPGAWVSRRWWEQDGLYLEGGKNRSSEESDGEEAISEEEGMPLGTTTGR